MEATNRMMGGLGYPPDVYTQNGSECANFIIKHVKTKNKLDMVECLEMIHKVVARQQTLEYLAMCGQEEWFLNESYAGQKIDKPTSTECQNNRENDKSSCSGDLASGDVISSNDSCVISVAPEDTQILYIPFHFPRVHKSLAIQQATFINSGSVYYIASKLSPDNPHKVIHREDGKFICDTSCVIWATYKFCAHTLAVAEVSEESRLFLNKVAMEAKPDAMSRALLDMLKGRGKKSGRQSNK